MSVDIAIRNGLVFDGTGAEPVAADVGLSEGRIALVGEVPEAALEIDAAGKVVTPGFIDIHSHSDYTLLVDPRAASAGKPNLHRDPLLLANRDTAAVP